MVAVNKTSNVIANNDITTYNSLAITERIITSDWENSGGFMNKIKTKRSQLKSLKNPTIKNETILQNKGDFNNV